MRTQRRMQRKSGVARKYQLANSDTVERTIAVILVMPKITSILAMRNAIHGTFVRILVLYVYVKILTNTVHSGYYCQGKFDHYKEDGSFHDCVHGNMRNTVLYATVKHISCNDPSVID